MTSFDELVKIVSNLDESKLSPLESLSARVIKDISDVLCPRVVIDFNYAIRTFLYKLQR